MHLMDPRPEEIFVEDVAHNLAHEPRFNGATREPYSVAQHSIYVARRVNALVDSRLPQATAKRACLCALLHDGPEAFIKDVNGPLKKFLPDYCRVEEDMWQAFVLRFDLVNDEQLWGIKALIKRADEELLATEMRDLMSPVAAPWGLTVFPVADMTIKPWKPWVAKARFLSAFDEYGGKR